MSRILEEVEAATSVPYANRGRRMSEFSPYKKADEVEKKINKMLDQHPITKENIHLWTIFHRTVQSGLTIIERKIEKVAKDATS